MRPPRFCVVRRGPAADAIAFAALLAVAMVACRAPDEREPPAPGEETEETLESGVTEGSAEQAVDIEPDDGERIVSTMPSATELVYTIGAGDRLVARSVHCDFPEQAEALPSIGSGLDPDVERILGLRPTLVLGVRSQAGLPVVASLENAGIEMLLLPDASVADVRVALTTLGARLDREAQAAEVVAELDGAIQAVTDRVSGADMPRALLVVDRDPVFAAGPDTFLGELLPLTGGRNALSEGQWVQLDLEAVIASAPEVIVEAVDGAREPGDWSRFSVVPAVRDDRVCAIDRDLIGRPGPRLAQAAEQLGDCLHPPEPEP